MTASPPPAPPAARTPPVLPLLRRWIPCPGTAIWLALLSVLMLLLRNGVVSAKPLRRAMERWQEARTGGRPGSFKWEDAAVLGTHWATYAALLILITALITMRWWMPRREPVPVSGPAGSALPGSSLSARSPAGRWFAAALTLMVILGAALRLPLATGSLWWDELWNVKYATVGEWRQEEGNPDNVRFQPASWSRAAWYFNKPTNHPVLTLPSKAAYGLYQAITGGTPGKIPELVLRLPVLAGGLGAVILTALLARRLAGPGAGLTAAFIAATHPWLIRYGVDARSYGLAVFFVASALYSLLRAADPGTRRPVFWWWIFGLCQFFLMWAHVVAHLAVCAALFAAAAWMIQRHPGPERWRRLALLLVVNLTAAALLLAAFLPNLLQVLTWGGRNDDGNLLTGPYFLKTLSQAAAGMDPPPGPGTPGIPVLPWYGLGLLLVMGGAAAVSGSVWLFRHRRAAAPAPVLLLVFTALFLAAVRLTDFYFYHRFIITVSIPLILLAAIGISRWKTFLPGAAALAAFLFLTWPQTLLLTSRSYAPFREVAAALRSLTAGDPRPPLPVAYGLGSHTLQVYLPELRDIRENAEAGLSRLISQARRENRPLHVAIGYEGINRLNLPDGFRLLDDATLFEPVGGEFHGIEPEFTFRILRLLPADRDGSGAETPEKSSPPSFSSPGPAPEAGGPATRDGGAP